MYHDWGYGSGGNDMLGFLYMLFWLLLIFIGALITVHYLRRDFSGGKPKEDDALSVLKTRYAKGVIDKKEFEQKKKDLKK